MSQCPFVLGCRWKGGECADRRRATVLRVECGKWESSELVRNVKAKKKKYILDGVVPW